jgi:YndJ-like protein
MIVVQAMIDNTSRVEKNEMVTAAFLNHSEERSRAFARGSAAAGFVASLLLLLARTADSQETEFIHKIVLYAVLVIVPLGLSLIASGYIGFRATLYRLIVMSQPVAAILTVASFFFEKGLLSAALSSAWLILCSLMALLGLMRFVSRRPYSIEELAVDAALLYLPVAAVWLVVYRLGVQPFDYGETIILLTAVHFHFAGFAAPLTAGLVGKKLASVKRLPPRYFAIGVYAIVGAMPLVAAGITFSSWLGLLGTLLLTTGLVMLAALTIRSVVPAITFSGTRLLLWIAALSSCAAMVLASLYSYSLVAHIVILRIPTMAMTHGVLNAFGFATCSLVAWSTINIDDERG